MLRLIFLLLLQCIDCASKYISILFFYLIVIIDITVQPVSINTTLNYTVVFYCEATADELTFRVNNLPADDTGVTAKGFSVTTSGSGDTIRADLQAIAYEHNNNTEVRCRASTDDPHQVQFSDTAMLMIQGYSAACIYIHHYSLL